MFWFDRQDPRAVFVDKRRETHALPDVSSAGGVRMLDINPDIVADFTELPFPANRFAMVVFDPPHLVRAGKNGWQAKKYGKLEGDWRDMLRRGFAELFRVLKPEGTLIFKWNEHEVPVSEIIALTPETPLIGQRCGKTAKTHWLVFMKPAEPVTLPTLIADLLDIPSLTDEARRLIELAQTAQATGTMPDLSSLEPPAASEP